MRLQLEITAGELVDRITILELKAKRLAKPQCDQVARELARARRVRNRALTLTPRLCELTDALRTTNLELWDTEEELRRCERNHDFGPRFVDLARKVYLSNDRRAALKQRIDVECNLRIGDHKSHALPEL